MSDPLIKSGGGFDLILRGKGSTFGPPGEAAGGCKFKGTSADPGVAVNPTGHDYAAGDQYALRWWVVSLASDQTKTAILQQIDEGPNANGRIVDVTGAGAKQMGLDPNNFPTDAEFTLGLIAKGQEANARKALKQGKAVETNTSLPNPLDALKAVSAALQFVFSAQFLYIIGGGLLLFVAFYLIAAPAVRSRFG